MAPLPFSIPGYRYEKGLQVLEESFEAAMDGVRRKKEALETELAEYRASLETGGPWIGERDDDGNLLWDREALLNLDSEEAEEAADELRKAFMLSIYHYWERSLRAYCQVAHGNHETIAKNAAIKGIAVTADLDRLRHLANALKHKNRKWGDELMVSWPDVLPNSLKPSNRTAWYSVITLTDAHIQEALQSVMNSGPPSKLPAGAAKAVV